MNENANRESKFLEFCDNKVNKSFRAIHNSFNKSRAYYNRPYACFAWIQVKVSRGYAIIIEP